MIFSGNTRSELHRIRTTKDFVIVAFAIQKALCYFVGDMNALPVAPTPCAYARNQSGEIRVNIYAVPFWYKSIILYNSTFVKGYGINFLF